MRLPSPGWAPGCATVCLVSSDWPGLSRVLRISCTAQSLSLQVPEGNLGPPARKAEGLSLSPHAWISDASAILAGTTAVEREPCRLLGSSSALALLGRIRPASPPTSWCKSPRAAGFFRGSWLELRVLLLLWQRGGEGKSCLFAHHRLSLAVPSGKRKVEGGAGPVSWGAAWPASRRGSACLGAVLPIS